MEDVTGSMKMEEILIAWQVEGDGYEIELKGFGS